MLRKEEHRALCVPARVLPVRRFFERQWDHQLPKHAGRIERLFAHVTEINTRLTLANDFLFKVDSASMRESLEVRVPMLDEDLFEFGLSLPSHLKVNNRTGKRVLRQLARRKLPPAVAEKRKMGFALPVDTWLNADFKKTMKDLLLAPSSGLRTFFKPEAYRPLLERFCDNRPDPRLSRRQLYGRAIMLLSVHLALSPATDN